MFEDQLKAKDWVESGGGCYAKGDWAIEPDTSSWLVVWTKSNPRVFDVPVPGDYESAWTVNLIEHLCGMEDERQRLRAALAKIRDNPQQARDVAMSALQQCHHRWLVNLQVAENQMGRVYCVVCGDMRSS